MKDGIHPNYQPTTIRCACGAVYETRSTKQNISIEICSKCHRQAEARRYQRPRR